MATTRKATKAKKGKATFGIDNTWEAGGVVEIPVPGGTKKAGKPQAPTKPGKNRK